MSDELPPPSPWATLMLHDTRPCVHCGAWWVTGWTDAELAEYRAAWIPTMPVVCRVCITRLSEYAAELAAGFVQDYLRAMKAMAEWFDREVVPELRQMCNVVSDYIEQNHGLMTQLMAANGPIDADPIPVRREARRRAQADREPWRRGGRPRR